MKAYITRKKNKRYVPTYIVYFFRIYAPDTPHHKNMTKTKNIYTYNKKCQLTKR